MVTPFVLIIIISLLLNCLLLYNYLTIQLKLLILMHMKGLMKKLQLQHMTLEFMLIINLLNIIEFFVNNTLKYCVFLGHIRKILSFIL